jgi:aryl-alcohol dehydrogenase-like predicted oxidoreductase
MKLGIGTAQFGMDYGVSNINGKVSSNELSKIFAFCHKNNIEVIDTAQIYGDSEKRISRYLNNNYRIITKFSLGSINKLHSLQASLETSLHNLSVDKVDTFMVHSFQLSQCDQLQKSYSQLIQLKQQGLINKIGISLYNQDEIEHILLHYQFDVIQIPINIFDQKLESTGILKKIKSYGVEIHARSAYLQGLCFIHPNNLTSQLKAAKSVLSEFRTQAKKHKVSLQKLALSYLLQIKEIDVILVGCTSNKELQENHLIILESDILDLDYRIFNINDETITNPVNWP